MFVTCRRCRWTRAEFKLGAAEGDAAQPRVDVTLDHPVAEPALGALVALITRLLPTAVLRVTAPSSESVLRPRSIETVLALLCEELGLAEPGADEHRTVAVVLRALLRGEAVGRCTAAKQLEAARSALRALIGELHARQPPQVPDGGAVGADGMADVQVSDGGAGAAAAVHAVAIDTDGGFQPHAELGTEQQGDSIADSTM